MRRFERRITTNKKVSLGITISLMAIAAAITFIITSSYSMSLYNTLIPDVQERAGMYKKLEQIDSCVRGYYNGTIDEDKLIESLAEAYISVLGSNQAKYYNADEYALYKERLSGTHLGIGVYVNEVGGFPQITQIIPNSPAANAGISVGESIVAVNNAGVSELGYERACSMLRAENGTPISITLRTDGEDRTITLNSVQMTVASVRTDYIDGYGYIEVMEFSEKTYQQFIASYSMLMSYDDIKGIVIDLRNNSGLIFDPVFNLLNTILPSGSVPYIATGLSGEDVSAEPCAGTNTPKVPIALLVNSKTSGPAELFAASMRDNAKAVIVGSTTDGNAVLFEIYNLYDNAAISLPISILRGSQTQFSGVGIKPDYDVSSSDTFKLIQDDPCYKKAIEILSQTN